MTVSSRLSAFLMAFLTILGCLLFLFSIILPFYGHMEYFHLAVSEYYWSFKFDYVSTYGGSHSVIISYVSSYWFFDYWFSKNEFSYGFSRSWMPVALFAVQALALAFGIASIYFKRRAMLAAPVCLSVAVLALMSYAGEIFPSGEYQLGYYLVFPSLALFLSAFMLNEVTKKQQTKDPISV